MYNRIRFLKSEYGYFNKDLYKAKRQNEKFIQRFGYSAGQMKIQNILAFPLFHLTTAPTLRESSLYNMKIKNKCEKGEAYPSFLLAKRWGDQKLVFWWVVPYATKERS